MACSILRENNSNTSFDIARKRIYFVNIRQNINFGTEEYQGSNFLNDRFHDQNTLIDLTVSEHVIHTFHRMLTLQVCY
jgi:hypothetical protein